MLSQSSHYSITALLPPGKQQETELHSSPEPLPTCVQNLICTRLQQVKAIQLNLHFSIVFNHSVCLLRQVPHSAMTSHADKPSPISLLPRRGEEENSKLTCINLQKITRGTFQLQQSYQQNYSNYTNLPGPFKATFSSTTRNSQNKKHQHLRGKSFKPPRLKLARIYTCPSNFLKVVTTKYASCF